MFVVFIYYSQNVDIKMFWAKTILILQIWLKTLYEFKLKSECGFSIHLVCINYLNSFVVLSQCIIMSLLNLICLALIWILFRLFIQLKYSLFIWKGKWIENRLWNGNSHVYLKTCSFLFIKKTKQTMFWAVESKKN